MAWVGARFGAPLELIVLRLPHFTFRRPASLDEACRILAGEGAAEGAPVRVVAGGTDLWPNLKRRQEAAATVVSLMGIAGLDGIANGQGARIGATQHTSPFSFMQ